MITIELDAFEAFLDAMANADRDISAREIGLIVRHLYDAGWRITRIAEPTGTAELLPDTLMSAKLINRPHHAWPPVGITGKLWAEINPGGLEEIEDAIGLHAAKGVNSIIFEAGSVEQAEKYWHNMNLVRLDRFEYDGTKFDYMTDQIPF